MNELTIASILKVSHKISFETLIVVLVILFFALLTTVALSYFIPKLKSSKNSIPHEKNRSSHLSINDYAQTNSKQQKQIEQLQFENKRLSNEIEELKKNSMQLITENQNLDGKLNQAEVNVQSNLESNEVILYERQSQIEIEYYDSHDSGIFDRSTSKNIDLRRAIFSITVDNTIGKLELLTGRMDSTLIADKDIFLESICVIKTLPGGSSDKIIVTSPGKVKLQGDSWVIDTKIQIEIN